MSRMLPTARRAGQVAFRGNTYRELGGWRSNSFLPHSSREFKHAGAQLRDDKTSGLNTAVHSRRGDHNRDAAIDRFVALHM